MDCLTYDLRAEKATGGLNPGPLLVRALTKHGVSKPAVLERVIMEQAAKEQAAMEQAAMEQTAKEQAEAPRQAALPSPAPAQTSLARLAQLITATAPARRLIDEFQLQAEIVAFTGLVEVGLQRYQAGRSGRDTGFGALAPAQVQIPSSLFLAALLKHSHLQFDHPSVPRLPVNML